MKPSFHHWLLQPRSISMLYLTCILITLAWLYALCGHTFQWMGYHNTAGDLAQSLSGWYAFANEPWHFPLLRIQSLDYPIGTNLMQTNGIPLLGLFFKLVHGILPTGFNYFGLAMLFCYVTQGVAATTLALSLRQKNLLATLCFTLFAISAPILNSRIAGEESLAFQSLLLFALALYFFNQHQACSFLKLNVYFGLLLGLSLLIHPYLTAMCYPFYLIALLKHPLNFKTFKVVLITHALLGLEFFCFGLGASYKTQGFGLYNMNLLAPFYGGYFGTGNIDLNPFQEEGFSYLGLGLMALCLITVAAFSKKELHTLLKRHKNLLIVALLFLIYALYGHLGVGKLELINLPTPKNCFITWDFRSNGRFFWPCFYLLMSFAIGGLIKQAPKAACIILPLGLIVQLWDVSGYFASTRAHLKTVFSISNTLQADQAIIHQMQQSTLVIYYPKFDCDMSYSEYHLLIKTQELAAIAGVPINTAYVAHVNAAVEKPRCGDDSPKYPEHSPQLLVAEPNHLSPTMRHLLARHPKQCKLIAGNEYCLEHKPVRENDLSK